CQRRQRYTQKDCQSRSKAAEEYQDHQGCKDQPNSTLVHQVIDGLLDELGLIKHHACYKVLRHVDKAIHCGLNTVDDCYCVCISALFHDRQIHRSLPINPNDPGLDLESVLGFSDLANENRGLADILERNSLDLFDIGKLAIGIQAVVIRPDLDVSRGQYEVRIIYRSNDIHHAQLVRLEFD